MYVSHSLLLLAFVCFFSFFLVTVVSFLCLFETVFLCLFFTVEQFKCQAKELKIKK